jgi:hypothetical protein
MTTSVYYKHVDVAALEFSALEKDNKVYVSRLEPGLRIQTPPVTIAGLSVADAPFAFLAASGPFATFLRDIEARVLDHCVRDKAALFPGKDIDDDALRHNFKSFFRDDGSIKVKVLPDVAVFDSARAPLAREDIDDGSHVRCLLELTRICFGRQEFGVMWRVDQVQAVEVPECLIDDAADEECADPPGDDDDTEASEFA